MSRPPFTVWEHLQALTVDVIRRLWDDNQHRDNKWLVMIHANWFDIWVEWKTAATMSELNHQIDEIVDMWEIDEDPAVDAYVLSETIDGETALGGEMRLTARWEAEEDA